MNHSPSKPDPIGRLLISIVEMIAPSWVSYELDPDSELDPHTQLLADLAADPKRRARLLDAVEGAVGPSSGGNGRLYDLRLMDSEECYGVRVQSSALVGGGIDVAFADGTPVGTFGPCAVYSVIPRREEEAPPADGAHVDLSSGDPGGPTD